MASLLSPDVTSPGKGPATPGGRQRLSLVIPAHNEEPIIRQAVDEAVAALRGLDIDYEVIVVDDGSTDGTREAALEAGRYLAQVRVISLPHNIGYAGALRRGFREARYELVAFTDADCQFKLEELGRLLPLARTADIACGIRVDRQDPWRRKVYSKGFNILARTLLGTGVTDCDCALKIFRRDWVNSAGLEADGFFFNAELLTRARQAGLTVAEVGVTHRPRQGGTSKVSIRHILPVLKTLLGFWWSKVLFSQPPERDPAAPPVPAWKLLAATTLLGLLAALTILPKLSYPLLDPDETRYAEIAREMLDSGNLLVPTRQGTPYLDKPPLLYWLTAASYSLFGTNEFSARFVTALAAIGTVLCTFWIGRTLVGLRAAWLGAFLQLMCIGFILSGRFLFMDSLLTLFTTISLLAGYAACRRGTFRPGLWALAAVSCGLGTLTKGPVAAVLCVPPLFAACWLTSAQNPLRLRHWLAYAGIAVGISLPWFVAVAVRQPQYFAEFIITHHLERFVRGLSHEEPSWFYIPILLIGMLPCSILFPAVVTFFCRGDDLKRYRTWDIGYLLLFAVWTFGLFSLSSCKLPPYILPAVPALCLVVGTALAAIFRGGQPQWFLAYVRENSPRDLAIVLCLGSPVLATIDHLLLSASSASRTSGYLALVVLGLALIAAFSRRLILQPRVRWGAVAVYALVVLSFGVKDFTPAVAVQRCKVSPVLQFCSREVAQSTPIVCYSLNQEEDAFAFYFNRQRVRSFQWNQVDDAIAALQGSPQALLFADSRNLELLRPQIPHSLRLVELGRYEHIVVGMTAAQNRPLDGELGQANLLHHGEPATVGPVRDSWSLLPLDRLPLTGALPGWSTAKN
ncbi:MAG TPA: glycosyltransferase [Planctomycetaceae bacterium]|nr:glycosyltransferase [Planctomycetaceae bacterium]